MDMMIFCIFFVALTLHIALGLEASTAEELSGTAGNATKRNVSSIVGSSINSTKIGVIVLIMPSEVNDSATINRSMPLKTTSNKDLSYNENQFCRPTLATAISDFPLKLFRELPKDGNLLICPVGISYSLAMLRRGAVSEEDVQAMLLQKHGVKIVNVTKRYKDLLDSMEPEDDDDYTFIMANGMFLQEKYEIKPGYKEEMEEVFKATVKNLDFAKDGKSAVDEINSWVASTTRNTVQEILDVPLSSKTDLAILSAAYFKGRWKYPFPENNTQEGVFYKLDNTTKKVSMMSIERKSFRFLDCNETQYKFLELPYGANSNISMLISLPYNVTSTPDLHMTSVLLCVIYDGLEATKLDKVTIPKFKMEHKVELLQQLSKMNINHLFDTGANFTEISRVNGLKLDSFFHKAVLEVSEGERDGSEDNEEMTVGDPQTSTTDDMIPTDYSDVKEEVTGDPRTSTTDDEIVTFEANHPFLLHIIDKRNGMVLFGGRVSDPTY